MKLFVYITIMLVFALWLWAMNAGGANYCGKPKMRIAPPKRIKNNY